MIFTASQLTYDKAKEIFKTKNTPIDEVVTKFEILLKESLLKIKPFFLFGILYPEPEKFNKDVDYLFARFVVDVSFYEDLTMPKGYYKKYKTINIKSCYSLPILYTGNSSIDSNYLQELLQQKELDITSNFQKVLDYVNITKYSEYMNL